MYSVMADHFTNRVTKNVAAVEIKFTEMQENGALKNFIQCHPAL